MRAFAYSERCQDGHHPAEKKKRKIARLRPDKRLIKRAPNKVVKVIDILSCCNKTSSKGRMAKGRT